MQNILEKLYFAMGHQNSELHAKDPDYIENLQLKEVNYEKLLAMLNEEEKDRFEKFLIADKDLKEADDYNTFLYAFKLGALLVIEIFTDKHQAMGER
ncbi:MAG: hypothetical protein FWE20_02220 [Defluviitaleaceae bacterium]|nr:hypothetical protein [Defluviitaleaceae bacterium]